MLWVSQMVMLGFASSQSTYSGFGFIDPESVYKVCDQPHPKTVAKALDACQKGDIDTAHAEIQSLWEYVSFVLLWLVQATAHSSPDYNLHGELIAFSLNPGESTGVQRDGHHWYDLPGVQDGADG